MLKTIEGLPEGVVGFEATGKVTGADYEEILVPAVTAAIDQYEKVRFLYVLSAEFDGYDGAALWDDAKVGMQDWSAWERIAVVTDHGLFQGLVKAFGFLMPGKVRVYPLADLDTAKAWITSDR